MQTQSENMKKIKFLLLMIIIIFTCTACSIDYEIKITKNNGDTIEEMITNLTSYDLPLDTTNSRATKSFDMLKKVIEERK